MPRGSKPGEHRGGRKPGTPNKRTTELVQAANEALANAGRARLPEIVVLRKLGKDRLIEIDEIAMALVYKYRAAAEEGDVVAEALLWKYLGVALDAVARRAPYESPRLAAVAVRDEKVDDRVITGESARERLLQTVLAVIAAEDAEAAARADCAIDVTPAAEPAHNEPDDDGDGEAA